jgi:hypothetical protein
LIDVFPALTHRALRYYPFSRAKTPILFHGFYFEQTIRNVANLIKPWLMVRLSTLDSDKLFSSSARNTVKLEEQASASAKDAFACPQTSFAIALADFAIALANLSIAIAGFAIVQAKATFPPAGSSLPRLSARM